jgi:hypothetical protein
LFNAGKRTVHHDTKPSGKLNKAIVVSRVERLPETNYPYSLFVPKAVKFDFSSLFLCPQWMNFDDYKFVRKVEI